MQLAINQPLTGTVDSHLSVSQILPFQTNLLQFQGAVKQLIKKKHMHNNTIKDISYSCMVGSLELCAQ